MTVHDITTHEAVFRALCEFEGAITEARNYARAIVMIAEHRPDDESETFNQLGGDILMLMHDMQARIEAASQALREARGTEA